MRASHLVLTLLVLGLPNLAWADNEPAAPAESEIPELIKQLDANSFPKRQAASVKLANLGKDAIPALRDAAMEGSREVTTRAIDILKQHYQGPDIALKQAAKQALEEISSTQGAPGPAERAREALAPKPDPNQFNQPQPFGQPGLQIIGGARIQIQAAGGRGVQRISIKHANGVKEIEAEENGRKVKINEDAAGGIKLEITQQKDGKETTEKFEAKNADELKKNHPDAHKIYEQYKNGGGIQIQAIPNGLLPLPVPGLPGQPGQPGAIPLPAIRRPLNRAVPDPEAQKKLDEAQKELRAATERLQAAAQANDPEAVKKATEEIREAQKVLIEALRSRTRRIVPDELLPVIPPPTAPAPAPKTE